MHEIVVLATPGFLTGWSHGQRSLALYSPGGHKESDTTWAHTQAHAQFDRSVNGGTEE